MKLIFALALLSTTLAAPVAVANNDDSSAKPLSSLWHSGSPFAHPVIPGGPERPTHLPAPGTLLAEAETPASEFAASFEISTSADADDSFGARVSAARQRLVELLHGLGGASRQLETTITVVVDDASDSDYGEAYPSQDTVERAADRAVQRTLGLLAHRRVYSAVLLVIAMLNLVTISLALRFFKKTACRRCGHVEDGSSRSMCDGEADDEFAADEQGVAAARADPWSYPVEKAPVAA